MKYLLDVLEDVDILNWSGVTSQYRGRLDLHYH